MRTLRIYNFGFLAFFLLFLPPDGVHANPQLGAAPLVCPAKTTFKNKNPILATEPWVGVFGDIIEA